MTLITSSSAPLSISSSSSPSSRLDGLDHPQGYGRKTIDRFTVWQMPAELRVGDSGSGVEGEEGRGGMGVGGGVGGWDGAEVIGSAGLGWGIL